ncbi:MAG: rRNA maturation RNase YbeY [Myxococcaceae bacterium]|nr:rRNA maturation RNase YbeY [Myxococcaceae bacterium]
MKRKARAFLKVLRQEGRELSIALVNDAEIRQLNRDFRRKDKATDVLSFPSGEGPLGGAQLLLGDVIISLDTARRVAKELGVSLEDELDRYLAHGILHLLGHDHHRRAERLKMARWEERLLGRTGLIPQR